MDRFENPLSSPSQNQKKEIGQLGLGQNFVSCFGPGQNFYFSLGPGRAREEIFIITLGCAIPEKTGPCRPLGGSNNFTIDSMHIFLNDKIRFKIKLTYIRF